MRMNRIAKSETKSLESHGHINSAKNVAIMNEHNRLENLRV